MTCYQQAQNKFKRYIPILYPSSAWYKKQICFDATDRFYSLDKDFTNPQYYRYKALIIKEFRGCGLAHPK
jgi:hypothetical protein